MADGHVGDVAPGNDRRGAGTSEGPGGPASPPRTRAARTGIALLRALRDGWLILGIATAFLFGLEGAYRLQAAAKRAARRTPAVSAAFDHPLYGQAWYPEYAAALDRRTYALDPYRGYWARPLASRYVNIDSAGRRVTPQPPAAPGARRVLLFGGSSMWGPAARDSFTIAAQLAAGLRRRGVTDVEVLNDAQPGFNATQDAVSLLVELARGPAPAAVVVMNGYNDVATAIVTDRIGITFAQDDAQKLLDRGRRGFLAELAGLGRHSALVTRLAEAVAPAPPPRAPVPTDTLCARVASYYAGVTHSLIAVAAERSIPVLVYLQPHHTSSRKRLTPSEVALPRDMRLHSCANAIAERMAPHAGDSFFDLRPLFDDDTATVFVDHHSHVTEAANGRIAERMADQLAPLLARSVPQGRAG